MSLKNTAVLSLKITISAPWSPISTPLILVLSAIKTETMDKGKKVRYETIYFNFRLDVGGSDLNHVNKVRKLVSE